jgi:hypothetical protein
VKLRPRVSLSWALGGTFLVPPGVALLLLIAALALGVQVGPR